LKLQSFKSCSKFKESLEAQYEERLTEEVQEIKEALSERVDSYLEYVADEWFKRMHSQLKVV
jgi:NTP pyrophosphatase (non-canonical NTP hydrolase)